jgi:NADH-quinone oxidoreductase subunit J
VGAIAVLFLFVVMMLNVKVQSSNDLSFIAPLIFFGIILSTQVFFNIEKIFFEPKSLINYGIMFDSLSNIDIFGQTLYNNFLICFLIAGLILLVAMVGAIVLTLSFKSHRKGEIFSRQLSRSDNFLSFFK